LRTEFEIYVQKQASYPLAHLFYPVTLNEGEASYRHSGELIQHPLQEAKQAARRQMTGVT